MARIKFENVKKTFGKVCALDGISFEIHDNEFFVLFGPAGAGKTTILNCVAGILIPDEGTISFNDQLMNLVDPARRNVAMVFENYALYPNMTVYDNMASPLRSKLYKTDENTIKEKVYAAAKMMKMENLLERLPSQLSNGQKQRVAMGRALVRDPNVFLMDEPLAHLDAKLRNSMRTELKEMQANLGSTCIYVTHDFMEAMALGDRIAIINKGKIIQIGSGDEIYYMPINEFVASLMGEPQINIIPSTIKVEGNKYNLCFEVLGKKISMEMPVDEKVMVKIGELALRCVDIGIRPQHIQYSFEKIEGYFKATVYSYESIGNKSVIIADCGDYQLRMIAPNGLRVRIDSDIYIHPEIGKSIVFDCESKNYIVRYDEEAVKALATIQEVR
ncbi:carbohydrate ABC transporter ATP-binding protein, CUT1 family [Sphaerochaeta associata]|uniref:ABC transporter ATP-binding protein n=1 Tax=Sphaerochaeta associata TaxID=1129264 RepID=A0ABY4DAF3_9SPIR|nr:ABC transporter ATP-binding protein [Sphaerochaeta associata]NCB71228.1 ABC transporter ATP-binding protein [Clostridia bacterium]UOM50443.1 ABC transporter ATP-binding protein [Sphaerochaeta associata]SMP41737.1 carbohydrate ABC transporter ATP-binding protein, CUT1 family [Sphaerochaeta associata]